MDLAKPVIAQVHGYCLAGGSELAAACDLTYVATDAPIGYPPGRLMSTPDTQYQPWLVGMKRSMELMLTGDAMSGEEAVTYGYANRHFPKEKLDEEVLKIAKRIILIPAELLQMNKRSVHRAMEHMGMRAALRAGTEIQVGSSDVELLNWQAHILFPDPRVPPTALGSVHEAILGTRRSQVSAHGAGQDIRRLPRGRNARRPGRTGAEKEGRQQNLIVGRSFGYLALGHITFFASIQSICFNDFGLPMPRAATVTVLPLLIQPTRPPLPYIRPTASSVPQSGP